MSDEGLHHLDEVEGGFQASGIGGFDFSGGDVAEAGVEILQLGAVVDERSSMSWKPASRQWASAADMIFEPKPWRW